MTSSFGFSSPAPKVRLIHAFDRPYENVVATARTCYSAKGIVTEDQASAKPDRRDAIAKSIYEAGHHTTFQHAHFQTGSGTSTNMNVNEVKIGRAHV